MSGELAGDSQRLEPPPRAFLLATCLALGFGFAEVGVLTLQARLLGRMVFIGRDAVWMVPLGLWLCFMAVALALLAARIVGRGAGTAPLVLVLSTLGFWGLGLMYSTLHPAASGLLAAGLGTQCARLHRRFPERSAWIIRRTTPALIVAFALVALGLPVARQLQVSGATSGLTRAPAGAPNVLLIVLDTVRARSTSLYGTERPTTPELVALASRGVLFANAHSTAPWTLPAHASLFTGRWPSETSADWRRPLDREHPTLAERLSAAGWVTAGFVANAGYASRETGLDRGFIYYQDYPTSLPAIVASSSIGRRLSRWSLLRDLVGTDELLARKTAADIRTSFLDWVDEDADGSRPFFAFLNFYDTHGPYMPPLPFSAQFASGEPRGGISPLHRWNDAPVEGSLNDEQIRKEREAYEGAIAYLDSELGKLFRDLEQRGLLDDTVVVVTADHGEEFGEHGFFDHANSMYVDGLHVPLLIVYPARVPGGLVISDPVSIRDVPATVLSLALGADSISLPGAPLSGFWDDSASPGPSPVFSEVSRVARVPDWYPVAHGGMQSLLSGTLRYVRGPNENEQLFDLSRDPLEMTDLSGAPEMAEAVRGLRARVDALSSGTEERRE